MRELVESRWIVGLLVGFFVLAGQTAIPVPTLSLSEAPSWAESHASYCACTSCSPTNCCCAMNAPREDGDGVTMLGYNCQPKVSWLVAVLPPAIPSAALTARAGPDVPSGAPVSERLHDADRSIGVPTPPPKPAA